MAPRLHTGLIGAAGEYHVAAQLSMRGWLATITIKNAPRTDVLAQHLESGVLAAIQTKTTSVAGDILVLGSKDERPDLRDSEWYILVAMRGTEHRPDFYVMPRNHVSALLWVHHRIWLAKPGRGGAPHKDTTIRNIHKSDIEAYRERWETLLEAPSATPYALPAWFSERVSEFGLPPEHPDAARLLWPSTTSPSGGEVAAAG